MINAAAKEPVIHHDHRKRSLSHWDLHHACNLQSITWIVNQITFIKLIFIVKCGTNMDLPASKIVLAKSINRIWKDQLLNCGSWGWGESFSWDGRWGYRFDGDMRSRKSRRQRRRSWLASCNQGNKNKQASALFHALIVSRRISCSAMKSIIGQHQ